MCNIIVALNICLLHCIFAQPILNKICTDRYDRDSCQQIARTQEFTCTENIPSPMDCFINIDKGERQFAFVSPEEALLAAPFVSDKVVVIGEVKEETEPFQTVVLVRKPYAGSFEGLKSKRLCHPGFRYDEGATRFILEEFESKVLKIVGSFCNTNTTITLLEKKISALAQFFGSSCRPGSWTEDDQLDADLKKKYSSLCDLCGVQKCEVEYRMPFNDALKCLKEHGGDIAITTLKDASAFFNISDNRDNFQYLCPNGTVLEGLTPCSWTSQLNTLIVTGSDVVDEMKKFIGAHLPTSGLLQSYNKAITESLERILEFNRDNTITFINQTPLKKYVEARRKIPTKDSSLDCGLTVKWCTLSNLEQNKCLWLRQASLNTGLVPPIECNQSGSNSSLSCLSDIQSGLSDIAFVDVNYGYTALRKGLTTVAFTETDRKQLSEIFIVIKNASDIKSFKDLKGKNACFPEYGGKEWLAFIDVMRKENVMEISCDYGKLFSEFVGESCVPGAKEKDYELSDVMQDKLCNKCVADSIFMTHFSCHTDSKNKYFGSDGALKCLNDNVGNFAVISRNDVKTFSNDNSGFIVLCRNGSIASYPGLKVDENAALAIITAGGVVAKNNTSKMNDIVLLLKEIEKEFGYKNWKPFKVFEAFNNTKDLLFPDSTPGISFGETEIKYVNNFKELLKNSQICEAQPNSGFVVTASTAIFMTTILALFNNFFIPFVLV